MVVNCIFLGADGVPSGYVVIAVAVGGCFAMMVMLALIEVKEKRKTSRFPQVTG